MRTLSRNLLALSMMAISLFIAIPVFAESAPVYDVDSGFDNATADQDQDLPPPPPPGQEGAYVPSQPQELSQAPLQASLNRPQRSQEQPRLSMDQRVKRVEQQIDNMQNSDLAQRLNSLQDQVQSLRGQLEQVTHQLQQVQNQQKSMYSDLDKRLTQKQQMASSNKKAMPTSSEDVSDVATIEPTPSKPITHKKTVAAKSASKLLVESHDETASGSVDKATRDQPNVAEEQEIYQTAYNMIKAKKYNDAVSALQGMLKKYPSGQFASNAHYWLGELYGLMKKNDQALSEFDTVVKTFPDSPRVSDAQLKVGLILASQSKWSEAKAAFKKVINRYPGTASARLAAENLTQINQAGH